MCDLRRPRGRDHRQSARRDRCRDDTSSRSRETAARQRRRSGVAGLLPALLSGGGIGELSPVVQPELLRQGRLVEVMPDWRFRHLTCRWSISVTGTFRSLAGSSRSSRPKWRRRCSPNCRCEGPSGRSYPNFGKADFRICRPNWHRRPPLTCKLSPMRLNRDGKGDSNASICVHAAFRYLVVCSAFRLRSVHPTDSGHSASARNAS